MLNQRATARAERARLQTELFAYRGASWLPSCRTKPTAPVVGARELRHGSGFASSRSGVSPGAGRYRLRASADVAAGCPISLVNSETQTTSVSWLMDWRSMRSHFSISPRRQVRVGVISDASAQRASSSGARARGAGCGRVRREDAQPRDGYLRLLGQRAIAPGEVVGNEQVQHPAAALGLAAQEQVECRRKRGEPGRAETLALLGPRGDDRLRVRQGIDCAQVFPAVESRNRGARAAAASRSSSAW